LTGLYPFYQYHDQKARVVQAKVLDEKETPYVDPRYRARSVIEGALVAIMEQCWTWDPDDRVRINTVVQQLKELKSEALRQEVGGVK
jgi:hypothetical protein